MRRPQPLAIFRPTHRQAFGYGAYVGLLVGVALVVLDTLSLAVRGMVGLGAEEIQLTGGGSTGLLLFLLGVLLVPTVVGGLISLVVASRSGTVVDLLGVHRASRLPWRAYRTFGPWPRIVEIQIERRGGRLVIVVFLDTGVAMRLPAPYDGVLLGRDPSFEEKYFQLRNLWETHRSWQRRA